MTGVVAGHLISKYGNLKGTSCQEANDGSATISGTQAPIPILEPVLEPIAPEQEPTPPFLRGRHQKTPRGRPGHRKQPFATYKEVAKG